MAPKRPAEEADAAAGSASEGSDAEASAEAARGHGSSPSPSKTPPPANPNPKSTAAPPSAVAPASGAGSDSGAASDSEGGARREAASPRSTGNPNRPRSIEVNSDSEDSALPVASDAYADQAAASAGAGADSDDGNASPLPPSRPSRAEAAAIKPISSRPMDPPPRRSAGGSEPRAKRPRSAAVASSAEHSKRPSRVWSQADELIILRGLITYRGKRGMLPGSTQDIGKLHSYIRSQLSGKVSITQLSDKVRRLKQKYQLLATRAKTGREEFPTPHDHNIYQLAKKVWGTMSSAGEGGGSGYDNADAGESEEEQYGRESDDDMESGRDNRHRKNQRSMPVTMANGNGTGIAAVNATVRGRGEFEKGKDVYPYLWETVEELSSQHPSGAVFKKAFELLEGSKAQVMEEKLRKFRLTEMRQQLRRMDLMKDTLSMVLDALEMAD
uniref:Glabrous enhancer-binding protein-like DBD domain-containing protein n=1 Tax=Oryza punctata TaxID=4537 RepID=A0A0E0M1X0_ORYPU